MNGNIISTANIKKLDMPKFIIYAFIKNNTNPKFIDPP